MANPGDVLSWYDVNCNKPGLFFNKKWPVTMETSLSTGDYVWASETGADIINDYFDTFDVERNGFDFYAYWPPDKFILFSLVTKVKDEDKALPLTLGMLEKSALAGRWLFG